MDELAALRADNARLVAVIDNLTASISSLTASLTASFTEQIAKLNDRIAELTAVARRKQHTKQQTAKPTTTPTPATAPDHLNEDDKAAFNARPVPPEKPAPPRETKTKQRPTGRKALPQHLESVTTSLRPEACGHCGSDALDEADTLTEEKLDVVKEHVRRRVVKRTTCRCRACGERTTPRSLPAPYPRSKVTGEFLAWLMHAKFAMLTPLDRVRRDLAERGVPLAMGTLVKLVERAADLLDGVDGHHWQQLQKGPWLATDSTGIKVLIPQLPHAHDGYLEQYRNNDAVVFQYEATKHGEIVEAKLKDFKGTVTSDAEHRFNGVFNDDVKEAGCNAHARRKFEAAEAAQPALAVEGGRFIGAMYGQEDEAKSVGLVGAALVAHRRQHTRPIVNEFEKWLRVVDKTLLPSDPLGVAVRYYRRHFAALTRFIDDEHAPIDNSGTERNFQHIAKLRLNMLFAGSTEGAHRACVLLGVVATCRALKIPVQAYLSWAFERLGTHRDPSIPIADLTPAAYLRQR